MATLSSPESGPLSSNRIEVKQLAVSQPTKIKLLIDDLNTIDNFSDKVSEMTGEDRSSDMGSGASAAAATGSGSTQISARATAIANLPQPTVMHQELEKHIHQEIHELEKLSRQVARSKDPGAAYHLNELYAKIRKLNSLLASLVEASVDLLKRMYVRIFVDKQPIFSS